MGDEIISVNGNYFERLTHDEAVSVLKSSHRLSFLVRYIGKNRDSGITEIFEKRHLVGIYFKPDICKQNGVKDKAPRQRIRL